MSSSEREAIAEADEWLKDNKSIPHEEVHGELGVTMADWDKMGKELWADETVGQRAPNAP